jgi:hypothetical protein
MTGRDDMGGMGANALHVGVLGVGMVAPGMEGWGAARAVLRGDAAWAPAALPRFRPALLPANERRRATWLVQLALRAVEDCLGEPACVPLEPLASVFASSGGDMNNLHGLCEQLVRDPKAISPTAFHNSVHNAVAGYFGIGAGARAPSVSLSAHDDSFTAGLLEALCWVAEREAPVLLVAYDAVAPEPLFAKRPVQPDVAVALLLAPADHAGTFARLGLFPVSGALPQAEGASVMENAELEALRLGNPAARALPLLAAIARMPGEAEVVLGERDSRWRVRVQPA